MKEFGSRTVEAARNSKVLLVCVNVLGGEVVEKARRTTEIRIE